MSSYELASRIEDLVDDFIEDCRTDWMEDHTCEVNDLDLEWILDKARAEGLLPTDWQEEDIVKTKWKTILRAAEDARQDSRRVVMG